MCLCCEELCRIRAHFSCVGGAVLTCFAIPNVQAPAPVEPPPPEPEHRAGTQLLRRTSSHGLNPETTVAAAEWVRALHDYNRMSVLSPGILSIAYGLRSTKIRPHENCAVTSVKDAMSSVFDGV